MDNINRWRLLASILWDKNKKAWIKEINGDLHFCDIILVSENYILVKNFGPPQREGKTDKIWWVKIADFDEYKGDKKNG